MLIVFGILALAFSLQAQNAAQPRSFEVASIKPSAPAAGNAFMVRIEMAPGGRYTASGVTLKILLQQAYDVRDYQIIGGPGWISTERYDINAKAETPDVKRDQIRVLLQSLLAERFQLQIHRETKELPVYNLVIGKGGHKLKASESQPEERPEPKPADPGTAPGHVMGGGGADAQKRGAMIRMGRGMLDAQMANTAAICNMLAQQLGRPVLDKTGLAGSWDFKLEWTPDETQRGMGFGGAVSHEGAPPGDVSGPSIFTALQEQLGLRLESSKGPVETLVIDRVEKPTEN